MNIGARLAYFTRRKPKGSRGFTLVEILIVTSVVGLLASMAIPAFESVREKAYNRAALADLNSAGIAIEEYLSDHHGFPNEDQLINSGFNLSPGVSFTTFAIRDGSTPALARVHIHIEHEASRHYYHWEYPGGEPPEKRWKSGTG